uniref:TPR_REGION domain-containing protein n=1 Tax=Steinernema glaseri TaxID=37863 RepID=A0A1I7ZQM3_9BILA
MSSEEVADEWATRNPAVPTLYGFDSSCSTSFLPCFSREGCAPTDPAELRRAQNKDAAARAVAKGVERMKNKQNLGAIQAFNEALSYDEHYADAYVARAATLANDGKFEPAVGDLERALAIDCEHQNARQYIVTTLLAWGNRYHHGCFWN